MHSDWSGAADGEVGATDDEVGAADGDGGGLGCRFPFNLCILEFSTFFSHSNKDRIKT